MLSAWALSCALNTQGWKRKNGIQEWALAITLIHFDPFWSTLPPWSRRFFPSSFASFRFAFGPQVSASENHEVSSLKRNWDTSKFQGCLLSWGKSLKSAWYCLILIISNRLSLWVVIRHSWCWSHFSLHDCKQPYNKIHWFTVPSGLPLDVHSGVHLASSAAKRVTQASTNARQSFEEQLHQLKLHVEWQQNTSHHPTNKYIQYKYRYTT